MAGGRLWAVAGGRQRRTTMACSLPRRRVRSLTSGLKAAHAAGSEERFCTRAAAYICVCHESAKRWLCRWKTSSCVASSSSAEHSRRLVRHACGEGPHGRTEVI